MQKRDKKGSLLFSFSWPTNSKIMLLAGLHYMVDIKLSSCWKFFKIEYMWSYPTRASIHNSLVPVKTCFLHLPQWCVFSQGCSFLLYLCLSLFNSPSSVIIILFSGASSEISLVVLSDMCPVSSLHTCPF